MRILVICGPTASGKSALAVECALLTGGEIISADALLVYKGLNIGTAKPSMAERRGVGHHMIDVVDPTQTFSVCDYENRALPVLNDLISRGKLPILCGGTGFYLNALLFKNSYGNTPCDEEIRESLEKTAREKGVGFLHEKLKKIDAESAEKIHPNDVKRVVRALEIYAVTGRKKSEQHDSPLPRFSFSAFCFDYPRETLYERIDRRVDEMLESGLVEEVKELLASGVSETSQCMQGIGYKEVVQTLKNGGSQAEMSELIKKNTRNYAKRQLTFFKKTQNLHWIAPQEPALAAREVLRLYEQDRSDCL